MSERNVLLASIATTISDYRRGELPAPNPGHVDRWVRQFDEEVQVQILFEMDFVLKKSYLSGERVRTFLAGLIHHRAIVGNDPCNFWKSVNFLDIQKAGSSQRDMLALFSKVLSEECGLEVGECGTNPHTFLYLDDGIFTGNRIKNDLESWVANDAPSSAKIEIVTMVQASNGKAYAEGGINREATKAFKKICLKWRRGLDMENRLEYRDCSDVLWPVDIPTCPAVQQYVESMNYKPQLRNAGHTGRQGFYSSDQGRQLLEQEFLKAGIFIRNNSPFLNEYQRPLGNMVLENLGFGSLIVTFRNCPNNAPLALWASNPWYPLFRRRTN